MEHHPHSSPAGDPAAAPYSGAGHANTMQFRKLTFTGMVAAVGGLAVSLYATWHHLQVKAMGSTDAFCNISDKISCDRIAQSNYSEVLGFPVGAWGMGYFVACLILLAVARSRNASAKAHMHAWAGMVVVGVVVSLALAGISGLAIRALCPTCLVVYAVCAVQAAALWSLRRGLPLPIEGSGMVSGGGTALIGVAATVLVYNMALRPIMEPAAHHKASHQDPQTGAGMMVLPNAVEIPLNLSAYSGLGEDYRRGGENPKVTVVEFADFQCPACQSVAALLHRLHDEFGGRVLFVFKNYPLDNTCNSAIQQKFHEHACRAAILARCAGQIGKFWQYHDLAYEKQADMTEARLKDWAMNLGVSDAQIQACLSSKDILEKIKDDVALANKLGVEGTPTLYINNKKYVGPKSYEALREYISGLLAQ